LLYFFIYLHYFICFQFFSLNSQAEGNARCVELLAEAQAAAIKTIALALQGAT
jgi:hypothetical protein